ncbi:hypothetical protein H6P81_000148 [Aristolochia fimbriata]|uniref:Epidermal patterning factor-like protein n=1 Tax=Aristolochia fimbriata TaxID=158543 RepID=A0AAV7F3A3_ARIFI|nr:hypothetical protein H6P81_000148 [Aristolochia fimbriata]
MFAAQKLSFCFMLIFLVLIRFWVAAALAASRPIPPVPADNKQGSSAYFLHSRWGSKQLEEKIGKEGFRGVDTLGSRPPSCDHKCGGCFPCQPTQVPATSDRFRVQYSNYEPEGWKCKCGTSLYNP